MALSLQMGLMVVLLAVFRELLSWLSAPVLLALIGAIASAHPR